VQFASLERLIPHKIVLETPFVQAERSRWLLLFERLLK
jgi:hypothetical protein